MRLPHFFGYGSLVNQATHDFPVRHLARVQGWRRIWRHTADRRTAFLTVVEDEDTAIDGLIAEVPNNDWEALDERERYYDRVILSPRHTPSAVDIDLHVYRAKSAESAPPPIQHSILLSYLDVVVQGYMQVFGESGVADFFATTDGWDAPVVNDRMTPLYSRAQPVTAAEMRRTDWYLAASAAQVQDLHQSALAGERLPLR